MTISIRPAEECDAESMVAMLNPIIEAGCYTILSRTYSVDEQREFVRGFPAAGVLNVAIDDATGDVIGMQDVMPVSEFEALAHVGAIGTFVRLSSHRSGIGRALLRSTIAAAAEKGFRKLMATIRADNPAAIGFYSRNGFARVGVARSHACINGRYIDEVLMERSLIADDIDDHAGDVVL